MAQVSFAKPPKPFTIDTYLGLNESVGDTEIKLGESVFQENFRITKNYKPQKRPGHHTFTDFGVAQNVQGIWYGQIAGKIIMLMCWNGQVYERDMTITTEKTAIADLITDGVVTIIGSITDVRTQIFWFNGKIYFKNGVDYKEYDGTTYQDIVPKVPTVAIGTPPAGGGTLFEEINLLTGAKKQLFIGDNTTTIYQLAETDIDSDTVIVFIDGVEKFEGVDFTVNRTLGQVTFNVAPVTDASVSIQWVKVEAGNSDLILKCKYAVDFGVFNDTNLFIWGNDDSKNTFWFSGLLDPSYFPVNSFVNIGTNEFAITDLKPNQQSLLAFKEMSTYIVTPEANPNYVDNTGLNPFNYPYKDLNERVGNIAPNMVQLIKDSPISLDGFSMWQWLITEVELQRNAEPISDRIKLSLQEQDLSTGVTFDYQNQKEYWLNIGSIVYIWNYGNDTFYKYTNIQAVQFIDVEGEIYYAASGTVERVSESFTADGQELGTPIPCKMKLGFTDFGVLEYLKTMFLSWYAISPASRTSVKITFVTDRKNEDVAKSITVSYKLFDFEAIDFADFSFLTNRNPQPFRSKRKIKKFTYLQLVFENNTNDETLTIIKLLLQAQANGYSK